MKIKLYFLIGLLVTSALSLQVYSQEKNLAEITKIRPHQVKVEGFRLNKAQNIKIEAVGLRRLRQKKLAFTDAWILNASNRKLVWELQHAKASRRGRRLLEFSDSPYLEKGAYEVYYSSYPQSYGGKGLGGWIDDMIEGIFDSDESDDLYHAYKREWDQFKIVIEGQGDRFREEQVETLRNAFLQQTFVDFRGLHDQENRRTAFKLAQDTDVEIYAVGEANDDGTYDYGWILDTENHKKIWKFDYQSSEHAGGAKKNRVVRKTIRLPKGNYAAFFVTDDSHSAEEWNMAPPKDPFFWGLTLRTANPSKASVVESFNYDEFENKNAIVKFTRMKNNEFRSYAFSCKKDQNVRIYAIGEGERDEMFDYAWIVDSQSHKKIWEMDYYNTEHAGGGDKNRLFDGLVELKKGDYIVYCVTDGSHSYWDWNTTAPYDQENWGVTILPASKNFNPDDVVKIDPYKDQKVLAQVTEIRNHERERERFSLERDTKIRIYAIGEGSHGRMHDYGWIENAETRDTVWEMTFRKTEHAGGAQKNRLVNDIIELKKGRYILYFETDDSHSFGDWNSALPYDPSHWGITLYYVKE